MPAHQSASRVAAALVTFVLLVAGCTAQPGGGTAPSATDSPAVSNPGERLSASPIVPSPLVLPSVEASIVPPSESPVDPAIPEPPAASLAVDGGDPVVGALGSFTWKNAGSDGPWVPGTPMRVGTGEQLVLSLATDVTIDTWTVGRTPAATVGDGVVGMGEGSSGPVTFPAPPSGSWSVNVDVWFADNLGSAAYYWLVTVE